MYAPPQGLKLLHREMLKKSSQEPLGQFQPNLTENMPGGWEFRFVQIRGWPLLGPNKGQNKENFDKTSKIFFS